MGIRMSLQRSVQNSKVIESVFKLRIFCTADRVWAWHHRFWVTFEPLADLQAQHVFRCVWWLQQWNTASESQQFKIGTKIGFYRYEVFLGAGRGATRMEGLNVLGRYWCRWLEMSVILRGGLLQTCIFEKWMAYASSCQWALAVISLLGLLTISWHMVGFQYRVVQRGKLKCMTGRAIGPPILICGAAIEFFGT